MKKILSILMILTAGAAFAQSGRDITVVSRESGSGTRSAFIELTGVEARTADGRRDMTSKEAIITNKTDVMMSSVAGNPLAIGYISLGSLNNKVKALNIDGAAPTAENIKNGSYRLARPFNIALSTKAKSEAQDFINFILSNEGQAVVADGYLPVATHTTFTSAKPSGRITVAGSSSVTPVMERLKEAYNKINPALKIEIQQSDSSTGMQAAMNGTCDIGMASRDLSAKELEVLTSIEIAVDGIAVIVNNTNTVSALSMSELKEIFTGAKARW